MNITNTKDAKKQGASILLYGESGSGKTTSIKTLTGKTLLIDIEGGTSVLRGADVDVIKIPSDMTGFKDAIDEICLPEKCGYDNVVLDSLTEMQTAMLTRMAAISNIGAPTLQDYNTVSFRIRDYVRRLRDLRDKGVTVVVVALETPLEIEQSEGIVKTKLYPLILKKLAPEICGLFDIVAHMEVSTKKGHEGQRFFRTDGDDKVIAKNRWKSGGAPFTKADFKELLADAVVPPAPKVAEPAKK